MDSKCITSETCNTLKFVFWFLVTEPNPKSFWCVAYKIRPILSYVIKHFCWQYQICNFMDSWKEFFFSLTKIKLFVHKKKQTFFHSSFTDFSVFRISLFLFLLFNIRIQAFFEYNFTKKSEERTSKKRLRFERMGFPLCALENSHFCFVAKLIQLWIYTHSPVALFALLAAWIITEHAKSRDNSSNPAFNSIDNTTFSKWQGNWFLSKLNPIQIELKWKRLYMDVSISFCKREKKLHFKI